MLQQLLDYVENNATVVHNVFLSYQSMEKKLILGSELWDELETFSEKSNNKELLSSPLASGLKSAQEALTANSSLYLDIRPQVAKRHYLRYDFSERSIVEVSVEEFLTFKESLVTGKDDNFTLEIDLAPFERDFAKMNQVRSIGHGVEFLNRRFSSRLAYNLTKGEELLLSFLQVHGYNHQPFMVNERINRVADLREALVTGMEYLDNQPEDAQWSSLKNRLCELGFEPGWGRNRSGIKKSFSMLADLLEAPDPTSLEKFLSRIPMIFNVVILSPHGFFGQENVLGLPDTGGQIVYILDQVRALEKEMQKLIFNQGLDIRPQILIVTRLIPECGETSCDQPEEFVQGTDNVRIIRIPFRNANGEIIPQWISRFEVWPYLERFAKETEVNDY